jgi:hypothetical protein
MERIPLNRWWTYTGHVARYRDAAVRVHAGETVNDLGCGIGYGSVFLDPSVTYRGYDKHGIANASSAFGFPGTLIPSDLDDATWLPEPCDVTFCFETLEHLRDPAHTAAVISATTRRGVAVSVPTQPTKASNPYHRHDFTVEAIPPLFPGFDVVECWPQPSELAHVWWFQRP